GSRFSRIYARSALILAPAPMVETWTASRRGPRREFSNVSPEAKSLAKLLIQRVGTTGEVRSDPAFEDARGPNVRELRHVQRRLSRPELEALVAAYEAGPRVGELARVDGIHRTTVSGHVARACQAP